MVPDSSPEGTCPLFFTIPIFGSDVPKDLRPQDYKRYKNGIAKRYIQDAEQVLGISILRTLEQNGIAAPSHCRSGECGWYHAKLVSGQVYTPKSVDSRREADLLYGYIHPCCSFPLSDLVIEVSPVKK